MNSGLNSLPCPMLVYCDGKIRVRQQYSRRFQSIRFRGGQSYLDSNGFDLLRGLLTLDPKKRLSADGALNHAYFREAVEMRKPSFDAFCG